MNEADKVMSVPNTYLGITANKLSCIATELEQKNAALTAEKIHMRKENAKLRELVRKWYPHMVRRVGKDALAQWGELDILRELGVEVDE